MTFFVDLLTKVVRMKRMIIISVFSHFRGTDVYSKQTGNDLEDCYKGRDRLLDIYKKFDYLTNQRGISL